MVRVILVVLVFAALALAQPPAVDWSYVSGGAGYDSWNEVLQSSDGSFICGGWKGSDNVSTWGDWWLMNLTPQGIPVWEHTYGGAQSDVCLSVAESPAGGYLLCGWGNGSFGSAITIRTNSMGDSIGGHAYAGGGITNIFTSVQRTRDGGFVLSGLRSVFGVQRDFWLVKLDAAGDSVWSRTYGGAADEWCGAVIQTSDGGYALAGETASYGAGDYDLWLVRTDSAGNMLWSRSFGGTERDGATSLLETPDGGFVLAGMTESFGSGDGDFWLVKADANCDSVWSRTFDGRDHDWCQAICRSAGGGYLLAGESDYRGLDNEERADGWILRVGENGDSVWSAAYSGRRAAAFMSVSPTADQGYILGGTVDSDEDTLGSAWIVKLAPDLTPVRPRGHRVQPAEIALEPSYPNPFNASTTLRIVVPRASAVALDIVDLAGRKVNTLMAGTLEPGEHVVTWACRDCASGTYFARLSTGAEVRQQRLVLLK